MLQAEQQAFRRSAPDPLRSFDPGGQSAAEAAASRALMAHCASSPDHVCLPETGADLKAAFHQIGEEISALRLSR
ncbi:hypothetical protein [Phenylobacterium sp.]|uniref:hypothetical protein n=1 Tax=Phenylobacterium sp. TaxID=1871053 RepID=UPI0035B0085E